MDGSNLVFIVVPIVIPLILAIGIALPFVAARDTTRAFSSARQLDLGFPELDVTQPLPQRLDRVPVELRGPFRPFRVGG